MLLFTLEMEILNKSYNDMNLYFSNISISKIETGQFQSQWPLQVDPVFMQNSLNLF